MMPTRYDVLSHSAAALRSTDNPRVRYGITLLRDALANAGMSCYTTEVERAAQGLIVLADDAHVRLGIAALSHMLGATVLPVPLIRIEPELPLALPYVAPVVVIDVAGCEVQP
jgi:hypothetical protein